MRSNRHEFSLRLAGYLRLKVCEETGMNQSRKVRGAFFIVLRARAITCLRKNCSMSYLPRQLDHCPRCANEALVRVPCKGLSVPCVVGGHAEAWRRSPILAAHRNANPFSLTSESWHLSRAWDTSYASKCHPCLENMCYLCCENIL
jgi:hypothetical protein